MARSFLVFIFLALPISCQAGNCDTLDPNTCSVLKDFVVADKNNNLHFNHFCSELDHYDGREKRAYAFFEKMDANGLNKALALVEVSVGWMGWIHGQSQDNEEGIPKGINVDLKKMQIAGFKKWGSVSFSLALHAKNTKTGKEATGPFSKTYFYSFQEIDPTDKKYTLSEGNLNWEEFIEPEEENSQTEEIRKNEYKGSKGIYIKSEQISHPADPHTLYLVINNEKTGDRIKWQGPTIKDLKSVWDIEYTPPQILTIGVLNPWQEGGLWDYIGDAFRYNDCIYLRKKAKKEFDNQFKK